jgi:hypothetical protein
MTQQESCSRPKRTNGGEISGDDFVKETEFVLSTMHAITRDVDNAILSEPSPRDFGKQGDKFYPHVDRKWSDEEIGKTVDFRTEVLLQACPDVLWIRSFKYSSCFLS